MSVTETADAPVAETADEATAEPAESSEAPAEVAAEETSEAAEISAEKSEVIKSIFINFAGRDLINNVFRVSKSQQHVTCPDH